MVMELLQSTSVRISRLPVWLESISKTWYCVLFRQPSFVTRKAPVIFTKVEYIAIFMVSQFLNIIFKIKAVMIAS